MQEPLDSVNYSSSTNVARGKEDDLEKESQPKDTQYLNANCVLLTYFSGDISSVVDEHFSRALSQPSSYSADCSGTKSLSWKGKYFELSVRFNCSISVHCHVFHRSDWFTCLICSFDLIILLLLLNNTFVACRIFRWQTTYLSIHTCLIDAYVSASPSLN